MENRLCFSDNLKSFALVLGILFHSSIIFSVQDSYALKNQERAFWFDIITKLIHLFRMPLFFFLAGFFSELVYRKKGVFEFCKNRFKRIVIPLCFGILLFSPIESFFSSLFQRQKISYPEHYFRFFSIKNFDFSHLWFLYDLVIFSLVFLLINGVKSFFSGFFKFRNLKLRNNESPQEKKQSAMGFFEILFFLLIGAVFSFVISLFTHSFFLRGKNIFWVDPVWFVYHFSFFLTGIFWFKHCMLNFKDLKMMDFSFLFFVITFLFTVYFAVDSKDPYWLVPFEKDDKIIRMFHFFLEAVLSWTIIFFLLALFKKKMNFENQFSVYLKNSSLPVYMIHYPISIISGSFLVKIRMDQTEKFLFHFAFVLFSSFFVYDSVIKNSQIFNRLLGNTKKHEKNS